MLLVDNRSKGLSGKRDKLLGPGGGVLQQASSRGDLDEATRNT